MQRKKGEAVMKKIVSLIIISLLGVLILSGCIITSHSFYYEYDELRRNLKKAEIIYMEDTVVFFEVHWYTDIDDEDYEIRKELNYEETNKLIKELSNIRFKYTRWWVLASVSNIHSMQGYGIKLSYENDAFMILAQTGDYRYRMPRFRQARAGRVASDEDWNVLMAELHFQRRLLSTLRPIIFRTIAVLFIISSIVLLTGLGSFILSKTKLKDINEKYHTKAVSKFMGKILLSLGVLALIADGFVRFWAVVLLLPLIFAIVYAKMSNSFRKTDAKHN